MKTKIATLILACGLIGLPAPARADQPPAAPAPGPAAPAAPAADGEFAGAMQLFYQQDWQKAIDAFTAIVQKDPNDSMSWFYLFDAYIKRNDLRSILYQFEQKAMASDNKSAPALAQLGIGYLARYMKEPNVTLLDESQKTLEKALEIDKNNPLAHTGLGLVYYTRRMIPRAKGHFLEALRANPNDLMAYERVGDITMVDEKQPKQANDWFQQMVAKVPSYPDGYWYVGSSYFDLGEFEKCIEYMQKVMQLDPNGITQGYRAPVLAGKACMKLKDLPRAKEFFLQALKLNPNSPEIRTYIDMTQNPPSGPVSGGNGNNGKKPKKGN